MNFFDLINLRETSFNNALLEIYGVTNTNLFEEILLLLRSDYSLSSEKEGKYTIRYLLLNLREEIIESVLPKGFDKKISYERSIYYKQMFSV